MPGCGIFVSAIKEKKSQDYNYSIIKFTFAGKLINLFVFNKKISMENNLINEIWQKGAEVPGYNSDIFRQDSCGAWIMKNQFGKETKFGWEIDHILPVSKGGNDDLVNLRPMHYLNNRSKGEDYLGYRSAVTASGVENVEKEGYFMINKEVRLDLKYLENKELGS